MDKLLEGGHFYEGARWHQGAWWVSDVYGDEVLRITPDGQSSVAARVEQPSGLGWLPNGDLLVVSMRQRLLLRQAADGTLSTHADLSKHSEPWVNDMAVDRNGHAYIGSTGFRFWAGDMPGPAPLFHISPEGAIDVAADDLLFPNGIVVSPDGKTLILAESYGNRLTAFTIGEAGALSDRRVWAQFGPTPSLDNPANVNLQEFAPDGCAIDREGCVWVADGLHSRVGRVADGGRIVEEVHVEGWGVYSCALGGEDGRTLLICAAPDFAPETRSAKAEAVLFQCQVEVPAVV